MTVLSNTRVVFGKKQLSAYERNLEFRRKLRGSSRVGLAFKTLCEAGCDPDWLERSLLLLQRCFPQTKRSQKIHGAYEQGLIASLRNRLASAAADFRKISVPLSIGALSNENGEPFPFPADPGSDRDFSDLLDEVAQWLTQFSEPSRGLLSNGRVVTFADVAPHLVDEVRRATGKPHFRQLSIVIGTAYNKQLSEAALKQLVSRAKNS